MSENTITIEQAVTEGTSYPSDFLMKKIRTMAAEIKEARAE